MKSEPDAGFYRAGIVIGAVIPWAIVLLMSLNREYSWYVGLLFHLLAGGALGALTGFAEWRALHGRQIPNFSKANSIGSSGFVTMVIGGSLVARRWVGAEEFFMWFCGWGTLRLAVLWLEMRGQRPREGS
jgi:hypothetical protein